MSLKFKKNVVVFLFFGIFYTFLEIIMKLPVFNPDNLTPFWALRGDGVSLWLTVMSGFAGIGIGKLNELPIKLSVKVQSVIIMLGITLLELIFGMIFNKWLDFRLWDYSHIKFNFMGQICLLFMLFWFITAPFAIWFDDAVKYYIFNDPKPESLKQYYADFFNVLKW